MGSQESLLEEQLGEQGWMLLRSFPACLSLRLTPGSSWSESRLEWEKSWGPCWVKVLSVLGTVYERHGLLPL